MWVVEAIDEARRRHEMSVWAYVIMPEHVHLLAMPRREAYSMQKFLSSLKRPVAWRAKQFLGELASSAWLDRLRVRKGERTVFRFWQAGGGFDRNITCIEAVAQVAEYLHANPVRRGLVKEAADWYWSSARWWAGDTSGPLTVDPVPAE